MKFVFVVTCALLQTCRSDKDLYRAAVVSNIDSYDYESAINEAAKAKVDILVLSSDTTNLEQGPDQYDELLKITSNAAKQGGLYVIAHLLEKTWCQNKNTLLKNNVVFGRDGAIISIYRKPMSGSHTCNATSGISSFTTDFGVAFGVLMEEDLVLQNFEGLDLKNFVLIGRSASEIPFLSASQFSSSWAFMTNANLVSSNGVYAGKEGLKLEASKKLVFTELKKKGGIEVVKPPVVNATKLNTFPDEDLSQYIIKPLNTEASARGYTENVCHGKFCCEFYVKTKGPIQNDVSYGLAAFDGIRQFNKNHKIRTQSCSIFACAGLYKRSCGIRSNKTSVNFEEISINGNYTKYNSAHYPIIISNGSPSSSDQFNFERRDVKNVKYIKAKILNTDDLLSFGVLGRDFSRDIELGNDNINNTGNADLYEYMYSVDVQEFFDYLWIRLRVLIFVVSIYFLEMM